MNKKLNTIFFILGATLFNIIVAVISAIIFLVIYLNFIMVPFPGTASIAIWLIFLASLAVSFTVYRAVLKYLLTKVDVEKYFDPLFVSKYRKLKPPQS